MYPVYWTFLEKAKEQEKIDYEIKWINSSQHKDLLSDLEEFFQIKADFNFTLTDSNNSETRLGELQSEVTREATKLFAQEKPDLIFIQGDTLTAQACAQAAFFQNIKVAHIEAGLRTSDIKNPFPEELSRRTISQIADLNFAPELKAHENLELEKKIFQKKSYNFYTGNTAIDCLSYGMEKISKEDFNWHDFNYINEAFSENKFDLDKYITGLDHKKYILLTAHRRENLISINGKTRLENLIDAVKRLIDNKFVEDYEFIFTVHKNPEVRKYFENFYHYCQDQKIERIKFIEGPAYPAFLKLMANSYFIVTDSGGIQEEAPYLQKPVLVFREHTERIAGLELGLSKLVGTKEVIIHGEMLDLMSNEKNLDAMTQTGLQPYGDGLAASRIVDATILFLNK